MKERERKLFMKYAFDSKKDFAENSLGLSFSFLNKLLTINMMLLGLPLKLLARNMKDYFVIYKNEIAAGYSLIYDKEKDIYDLGNLFTRPEYQKRGIASIILQMIISSEKIIKLNVNAENLNALHLYEKFGFVKESSIAEYTIEVPFKSNNLPEGYNIRLATKKDLDQLQLIINHDPDMKNLAKAYNNSFNKTKKRFWRLQNQLPMVLIKNHNNTEEIYGIGRAIWSKAAPS